MTSVVDLLLGGEFRRWAQAIGAAVHKAHDKHDCCAIPETQCPPRCQGSILWTFGRGATPTAAIVVRNVGSAARTFEFKATPLSGSGVGSARVTAAPASASLSPGASIVVSLRLEDSAELVPAQKYLAEFQFTGSWQQCVAIECHVLPDVSVSGEVEPGGALVSCADSKTFSDKIKPRLAIVWKIERGVTPLAHIALSNPDQTPRNFAFSTTPLVGLDAEGATLVLSSSHVVVDPRGHAVLHVRLQNTAALSPGQDYHAALSIDGLTRERVPITCVIKQDPAAHAEVSQGDFPTHLRAHHWYDHFQCTVPCAPGPPNPSDPDV
jgi:hypothetical protein